MNYVNDFWINNILPKEIPFVQYSPQLMVMKSRFLGYELTVINVPWAYRSIIIINIILHSLER